MSTTSMAVKMCKERRACIGRLRLRPMAYWLTMIPVLMTILAATGALAENSAKIEKIPFTELNRMVTEKNRTSMVVFMAAWCRPCKEELPIVNQLFRQFHDKGVRFIGVSIDTGGPAAMERVLKKQRVDFPVYWVGEKAVDKFNLVGIPMTFLIKNGRIVDKIPGKCSYTFLEGRILDLLK